MLQTQLMRLAELGALFVRKGKHQLVSTCAQAGTWFMLFTMMESCGKPLKTCFGDKNLLPQKYEERKF